MISQILPFRSGFHTPMLEPYLDPIRKAAEAYTLHPAALPLRAATTVAPYPDEPAAIRELFIRHLLEPVRFRPLVETMYAAGFRAFVQLGAGQLGSLIDDTLHGRDHLVAPGALPAPPGPAPTPPCGRRVVAGRGRTGPRPAAGRRLDRHSGPYGPPS